ncbi:hypothetical protein ACJRO7_012428 [Eucalyptus globulus]|uniref:RING-type domain-containing protein n=1 Tax=Eucalyptus globulus TaxID=34317 RepID=A0ABD3LIH0_EUCGL
MFFLDSDIKGDIITLTRSKIAKTGSLCCVAARPHGSHAASGDWSVGPHEPYWRTNTSFSPPPSRLDIRLQYEGLPNGLRDSDPLYRSSTSSNSKGSRGWVRGNRLYNHQYSASDGAELFLSSPSDQSQGPQWTPPAIQEINVEDYGTPTRRDQASRSLSFASMMEGTTVNRDSLGSCSSHSDSSESEPAFKSCMRTHRNISSRRFFISKPIHPLSFPTDSPAREDSDPAAAGILGLDASSTPQRDVHRWSSGSSSVDLTDASEPLESEIFGRSFHSHSHSSDAFRCGLCERFLSHRSPWSSRRIVRSGDMPVAGVLSCSHVFHAECLEQTTPKMRKSDPPCPLCARVDEGNSPELRAIPKMKSGFPRLRTFSEGGPSRPSWGCTQVGDCVEGALHAPPRNAMILLNRNRVKKNLSLKGTTSKEYPGKLRKTGSHSSQFSSRIFVDQNHQAAVGCSNSKSGPSVHIG